MRDERTRTSTTELVRALQERPHDSDAAAGLADRARTLGLPIARSLIEAETVDDVVQDAVIEMLSQLPALRDAVAFPAWFARIVRKHADRHRRRRRPHEELDAMIADTRADVEESVLASESAALVRAALLHASDRDRMLLDLKYVAEWSDAQLSDLLGISAGAVRKRLFDARRRARSVLTPILDFPPTRSRQETLMPYQDLFGGVHRPADLSKFVTGATAGPTRPVRLDALHTGFPAVDLLVPIPRGGVVAWRAGSLYLISELIGNLADGGPSALVAIGARRPLPNGIYHRLHRLVTPTDTGSLLTVVDVREGDDDLSGIQAGARLAALVAADGVDVVLGIDAVIAPTIAGAALRSSPVSSVLAQSRSSPSRTRHSVRSLTVRRSTNSHRWT